MMANHYTALKRLVALPEWKAYESFLQERFREEYIRQFTNDGNVDLKALQVKVMEFKKIMGSVHDYIAEHEAIEKEKNK